MSLPDLSSLDLSGIARAGVSDADIATPQHDARFDLWIAQGRHAGMKYMENHREIRRDCRLLLPGAQSVISCALSYYSDNPLPDSIPYIARYARGRDYHEVVRERLETLAAQIRDMYGGETRVCVDSAPIHERHRAVVSGVGYTGRNGLLIVPGVGSWVFLGEILTTVRFLPTPQLDMDCGNCRACVRACPGHALDGSGAVNSCDCLSYLTIEHRGEFKPGFSTCGRLVGCDTCQAVCPHNTTPVNTPFEDLKPRDGYGVLSLDHIDNMTQDEFSALFSHSAIKRLKLQGLKRNAKHL